MDTTPGFEFPANNRDVIGDRLSTLVGSSGPREPMRSVRPERQPKPVVPLVTPTAPQAVASQSVRVAMPNPTHVTDPEGISVSLPSKFHYYDFKDLYVRPFRLSHLAKIAKAHETSSMQTLAEVVSSVLSTPQGHQNIAFGLLMSDFNAVLYWLRLNSFSQKQMRLKWQCSDPAHLHAVETGEKTPESLNVTSIYTSSQLSFNNLEEVPDPAVYRFEDAKFGLVNMRPETVADVIDFMDHPSWEDPEFQFVARVASVLDLRDEAGKPLRLDAKVASLDDLSPDVAVLANKFVDLTDQFGVNEIVNTNCIGCGASSAVKIAVDALSFLSPEF